MFGKSSLDLSTDRGSEEISPRDEMNMQTPYKPPPKQQAISWLSLKFSMTFPFQPTHLCHCQRQWQENRRNRPLLNDFLTWNFLVSSQAFFQRQTVFFPLSNTMCWWKTENGHSPQPEEDDFEGDLIRKSCCFLWDF